MEKQEVFAFAKRLLNIWKKNKKDVKKIKITGVSPDFEKSMIDLINDIMKEEFAVTPNKNRRIPYRDRKPLARKAWEIHQQDIAIVKKSRL